MKRREFIALLGGAAVALPVAARTEQHERMQRTGVLFGTSERDIVTKEYLASFAQGLAPLGWSEGRNMRIEKRWAGGETSQIKAAARELVRLNLDVILVHGTETSRILQQETRTIPLVFTTVTDPVGSGLVASLARPGGNITGFTNFEFSMAGKWLGLLKEAVPNTNKVIVLFNPDNAAMPGQLHAIAVAAPSLALQVAESKVRNVGEIERALNDLAGSQNTAVLVLPESLTTVHRELIVQTALRHRLPSVYGHRYFTASGGLMSYGVDNNAVYRRAAEYVHRIMRGEKASDLPVQQPIQFELVVNLKAAKALGIDLPSALISRADEVIE